MIDRKIADKALYNSKKSLGELRGYLEAYKMIEGLGGLPFEHRLENTEITLLLKQAIKDRKILDKI